MKKIVELLAGTILFLPFICALPFLPNIFDGLSEAKLLFLYVTIAFVCIGFGIYLLLSRETILRIGKIDITILVLSFVFLFAGLLNRHVRLEVLLILLVYYFVLNFFLSNECVISLRALLWSIVAVASTEAIVGILQSYSIDLFGLSGYFKVVGTFGNPDYFAGFIVLAVPIGLSLHHMEERRLYRGITLFLTFTIVLILPAAFIRSSWIALAVGVVVYYGLRKKEEVQSFFARRKSRRLLTLLVPVVMMPIGYFIYSLISSFIW